MKNNQNTKKPLEFFEHTTNIEPHYCDHKFTRLSVSRIVCKKCGLGFYDNPFSPFPVEEINEQIKKEIEEKRFKKEENIENIN